MLRPTMQGRKGFRDPAALPPGVSAPFGQSAYYAGTHHGVDFFWLSAATAAKLGMTSADSLKVYAVVDGPVWHTDSKGLGTGLWQQIDAEHRFYWWHLSARDVTNGQHVTTADTVGTMGHTGTAAGKSTHLHSEVRKYPYGEGDRIDPEPFFNANSTAGSGATPFPVNEGIDDMSAMVIWDGQNPAGGQARWALIGVEPGKAMTTRSKSTADAWAASLGVSIFDCGSSTEYDTYIRWVQQPLAVAGGTSGGTATVEVDSVKLGAAVAAALEPLFAGLGQKIDALPAEIDRYADGTKQS